LAEIYLSATENSEGKSSDSCVGNVAGWEGSKEIDKAEDGEQSIAD